MKSIKFGKTEIIVTYNDVEQANRGFNHVCNLKTVKSEVVGNVLTIKDRKYPAFSNVFLFYVVKRLLCHIVNDDDFYTEKTLIDGSFGTGSYHVLEIIDAITKGEKLFKMTPTFKEGVKITQRDFGLWQYGSFLRIKETVNGYEISIRNSNLDGYCPKIVFDETVESILVEIGEIQF